MYVRGNSYSATIALIKTFMVAIKEHKPPIFHYMVTIYRPLSG